VRPLALILSLVTAVGLAAQPSFPELSSERFMGHVSFLASDDMNGRGNGTPELARAARYIAAEFESYGLKPSGQDGSFLQEFPITVNATVGSAQALSINDQARRAERDFVTLPLSASGAYEGPVVFAGYGITAPQVGWDDYAGIDVAGKAVVVFTYHPTSALAPIRLLGSMSSFEMKARNAKAHGAHAIFFVRDPGFQEDSLIGIDTWHILPQDMGLLAMYVSLPSIEPLFKKMGLAIADVKPWPMRLSACRLTCAGRARLRRTFSPQFQAPTPTCGTNGWLSERTTTTSGTVYTVARRHPTNVGCLTLAPTTTRPERRDCSSSPAYSHDTSPH
jgi:hypothetical protein